AIVPVKPDKHNVIGIESSCLSISDRPNVGVLVPLQEVMRKDPRIRMHLPEDAPPHYRPDLARMQAVGALFALTP
ncbi:MAG: hypothetical protein ACLQVD_17285, partial [Capsulimonadaceae bacterium]